MKVHEVMSGHVVTASPGTPVRKLWEAIFKKGIHGLPVVDSKKKLVGIVAEEDLLKLLYPKYEDIIEDFTSASDFEEMEEKIDELTKLKAEHIMCKKIVFTRPDTPIMRALSRMIVRDVRQLPVVSEENILIGMITKGDIFDILFKKHLRRLRSKIRP
ncbi:CBS domain-containing protein [Candidatus Gottesmanbacteria bacterium]|nr:CBS domain-containing protein [Candidatus Gottesmanbacteria bacterium]